MHVLIIHQNFVDHRHPGGTRHLELARHLVRQGHECTVVAGRVDYLTGTVIPERCEEIDGVQVKRAFAFATLHKSYFGRAMSYCSFMVSCVWTGLRTKHVDVVLGTSPPIFQLPSTWLICALKRRPFVLEVRDLWPEFPIDMGILKNTLLIRFARFVENFHYKRSTEIVANSPGFRDYLIQKGVPERMLTIVPNGVETSMFVLNDNGSSVRQQFNIADDQFLVTYAGAMGAANNLGVLLDAAELLKRDDRIRFLLVGGGKQAAQIGQQIADRNLNNVTLGGVFPKDRMTEVLAASNVCVASLQDIRMFRTTYPNKVFDYMAAGRPTLLLIDGVIRDVIENADGGRFISPNDHQGLSNAIVEYRDDPELCKRQGTSAREYVKEHFDRVDQANQLEAVLKRASQRVKQMTIYQLVVKRVCDMLATSVAIVLLSPVILITAILIRINFGSPVIFTQKRAGRNGRSFNVFKFRTMTNETDDSGKLLPDDQRLTRFGRLLRSLSLDELPQLWNIIRGDMSLVGPRPLLISYLERYSTEQARRHEVRPGITGWAQVHGRNAMGWEDRFRHDVWYVDHCTFWLDLRILVRTVLCVMTRQGISSDEHATMSEFMGSETSTT